MAIVEEDPGQDAACTTRSDCASPMRAGIRIYRGSTTSSYYCTMGFIVRAGSDEQFLTAGHCGHVSTPNCWYHPGYGTTAFGCEINPGQPSGTLYVAEGKDVMRVQLPDAQASRSIFDEGTVAYMNSDATPLQGQAIVASGSKTDQLVTGTVTSSWRWWNSQTCGCRVWGGSASFGFDFGDSGGPVYSRTYFTSPIPGWHITPIGVIAHEDGHFARVFDATTAWNLTMYNP